jgi:hypothetical protein
VVALLDTSHSINIVENGRPIKKVLILIPTYNEANSVEPIKKAQFFGAIFKEIPCYSELKSGTAKDKFLTGFSKLFRLVSGNLPGMVAPPRLELGTQGSSGLCSTN